MMTRAAPTPHRPTLQCSAAHGTTSSPWVARRSPLTPAIPWPTWMRLWSNGAPAVTGAPKPRDAAHQADRPSGASPAALSGGGRHRLSPGTYAVGTVRASTPVCVPRPASDAPRTA
jgi:hypothetical protein